MSDPNVLDMETAAETTNYRKSRLEAWAQIQKKYEEYRASALKHGASKAQAEEAAGRDARGSIRWIVGESLAHAPGEVAAKFITDAPREWGARAEILLDADPVVPEMLARTYPVTAWATKLDVLTRQVADDNAAWQAWVERMLFSLGPFGVTNTAASSIFGFVDNVGKGVGGLGAGIGEAAGGFGKALGYLPLALGAVGLGATVLGLGYWASTRRDVRPDE